MHLTVLASLSVLLVAVSGKPAVDVVQQTSQKIEGGNANSVNKNTGDSAIVAANNFGGKQDTEAANILGEYLTKGQHNKPEHDQYHKEKEGGGGGGGGSTKCPPGGCKK